MWEMIFRISIPNYCNRLFTPFFFNTRKNKIKKIEKNLSKKKNLKFLIKKRKTFKKTFFLKKKKEILYTAYIYKPFLSIIFFSNYIKFV